MVLINCIRRRDVVGERRHSRIAYFDKRQNYYVVASLVGVYTRTH